MRLLVLSPHCDDAVFSLALSLKRWSAAGAEITVLNFFTQSAYAPRAREGADISALRAGEDRRSLRSIDHRIRLLSLPLLDAPLRLPIDFGSIANPAVFTPLSEEVERLADVIRGNCRRSLVIAPLALGDHIDHRTILEAAISSSLGKSLGFYEDLPYATWTPEDEIQARILRLEERLMTPLRSFRQRSCGMRFKKRAVQKYHSQIDDSMAAAIARYSEKYRGAERIWASGHSAVWNALLTVPHS